MERAERTPVTAWVGLGANLGDAADTLRRALDALAREPGVAVLCCSSFFRSAPWEAQGPDFVNAVAELGSTLNAPDLLSALQRIEAQFGRERPYRNSPRSLDLDLLLYGGAQMDSPHLTLPHPRMRERAFVLVPLAQIAPELVDAMQLQAVIDQDVSRLPAAGDWMAPSPTRRGADDGSAPSHLSG